MELRTARERLGWDLPAVSAGLRIKLAYLTAIEEGRLGALPGNAYAAGFLRTYASALGLDPDEVSRRLTPQTAEDNQKPELTSSVPVPRRRAPVEAFALVGLLVLAIGAYAAWHHFLAPNRRTALAVPQVPARVAATTGTGAVAATPAPAPPVASTPAVPTAPPAATPPPTVTEPTVAPPLPNLPPSEAAAAPPQPSAPPAAPAPTALAKPEAASAKAAPAAGATPPKSHSMMLRATAEAWMQVRQKDGRVLLNRVMRPGETWPVPADEPDLVLSTGNAGGTELVVDGVSGPPLGGSGAVLHDLPLGPALAKAAPGSTAPPAAR